MNDNSGSLWAPLRFPAFRWLWLGALAMNLAIWMQNVGAAWLMVSLTTSPMLVALVQTAISLPSFFFGLPGGVFADIFNRQRYLLVTHAGMLLASVTLVGVCAAGVVGPWALLGLTFAFGIGFALQGPAWYTTQAESVPRAFMASAMALSSVSYSAARAVGPALAGGVVAVSGVVSVFIVCTVLLCGSLLVVACMRRPADGSTLPVESLWSGLRSALRYARHSSVIRGQCLRTIAFVSAASALWALLAVVARDSGGAGGYGLLLGSIGAGTMFGALILPVLRARLELNRMIAFACVVYALGMFVVAQTHLAWLQCTALFIAGIGWMCIGTSNLVAIQSAVPPWIRARSVAIYMLVFQGALAIGGAAWGAVASHFGTRVALMLAAAVTLLSLWVMQRYQARLGEESEVTPSTGELPLFSFAHLEPSEGPVAVQIAYQVRPEDREEFLRRIQVMGIQRRRDGAGFWRVYRELERPAWYMERFIVDSWSDYLRHQARTTMADREAEARVRDLHCGEQPPTVSHYISEAAAS
ncbi:MFS transporter [Pseudomonas nitroreducens]|uniref:MFS transporter n=1 Tax=Pseudomonas nitroreducens TaxID=46680 RepID=A0ABS0KGA2_PSENT|nr:MFS transporter [Pseudomonas nitroreducens]MBG6287048.1 MFS transporter [Pseudomonas nitroreducens]